MDALGRLASFLAEERQMAKQPKSLSGRVVAITGAARGIGKATAAALVRQGARVAIADIDAELARRTADELGGGVRAYEVDVTSRPSVAAFLDAVERDLGPLDVMVNNAGIMPIGPFLEEGDGSAVRQLDINIHGVIFGMKEALPRMLPRRSGHIVNLASVAGKAGFPHLATYCASKHAVIGLTESVRSEFQGSGIEFTCILPSLVDTELTAGLKAGRGIEKAKPEDVADAIVEVLQVPRVEVYVPRVVGKITAVMQALPRPAREAIGRMLDGDKVMVQADMTERRAYEDRVAASSDHLETAEQEREGEPVG
jgi:NAD(P)-dependent dehydrogenase (short-subunit alcohol dehydrogenase family)